jgi:hypothetical protein
MKKLTFLLAAFFVVGLLFTSCTKTNTESLYEYTTDSHVQTSLDDVSALDDILRPKLHHGFYHLTNDEAHAEWNSFLKSVENVNVSITGPGHYFTAKFVRKEAKDGAYVIVETIGEKTWNSENN